MSAMLHPDVLRVDRYHGGDTIWPARGPLVMTSAWLGGMLPKGPKFGPTVSPWEAMWITAGISNTDITGLLGDMWRWWDENVRGRVWRPRVVGGTGGLYPESPPRVPAPSPLPEAPSPADWVTAQVQTHLWAAERYTVGKRARRQAAAWAELRDLAEPEGRRQLAIVVDAMDWLDTEIPNQLVTPENRNRRASLWA